MNETHWLAHAVAESETRGRVYNFKCPACECWSTKQTNFCPECGVPLHKDPTIPAEVK